MLNLLNWYCNMMHLNDYYESALHMSSYYGRPKDKLYAQMVGGNGVSKQTCFFKNNCISALLLTTTY